MDRIPAAICEYERAAPAIAALLTEHERLFVTGRGAHYATARQLITPPAPTRLLGPLLAVLSGQVVAQTVPSQRGRRQHRGAAVPT